MINCKFLKKHKCTNLKVGIVNGERFGDPVVPVSYCEKCELKEALVQVKLPAKRGCGCKRD